MTAYTIIRNRNLLDANTVEDLLAKLVAGETISHEVAEDLFFSAGAMGRAVSQLEAKGLSRSLESFRTARDVALQIAPRQISAVLTHLKTNHPEVWEESKRRVARALLWHEEGDEKYAHLHRYHAALLEVDFLRDSKNPLTHWLRDGVGTLLANITWEEVQPEEAPLLKDALIELTLDKLDVIVRHLKRRHPNLWEAERRFASLPLPRGIHEGYYAYICQIAPALRELRFLRDLNVRKFHWMQMAILRRLREVASG